MDWMQRMSHGSRQPEPRQIRRSTARDVRGAAVRKQRGAIAICVALLCVCCGLSSEVLASTLFDSQQTTMRFSPPLYPFGTALEGEQVAANIQQAEGLEAWRGRSCPVGGCRSSAPARLSDIASFGAASIGGVWLSRHRQRSDHQRAAKR